jgi:hypothetical protein
VMPVSSNFATALLDFVLAVKSQCCLSHVRST